MSSLFTIKSDFQPAGDQPQAIDDLVEGFKSGNDRQTLFGVTGSGKTFSVAHVIKEMNMPTLILAHNKTLAAQLAQEYKDFFPTHNVHYFVSYYDYYQPEAYVKVTDTYIEKDAQINEEIDRLRHASTQALLTSPDTIIVASVSCIYGLGSPEEYRAAHLLLEVGAKMSRLQLITFLVSVHYERTNVDLKPGMFRSMGNIVEIMPVQKKIMYRIMIMGGKISEILVIDPVSSVINEIPQKVFVFPSKHFLTNGDKKDRALIEIEAELKGRLKELEDAGLLLEAQRLKRRTTYDLAMIREVGYCSGVENYSRPLSGKAPGEAPETLLSYFPHDKDGKPQFLTVIDESHVTLPQVRAMYAGDQARKKNLVDFGFRLPSAMDNRPLRFEEFLERVDKMLFVTATPAKFEKEFSQLTATQVIRPTGLLDPALEVRPVTASKDFTGQVQDFISEAKKEIDEHEGRVIATTLTKAMAEDLTDYLKEKGIKTEYIHSDVDTLDRIKILTQFRRGEFDCLVGVNLLREGLDLPEVSLIGIFDTDKEGFLRSETSLIQTIGRAARNVRGRVILYADRMTGSMERAIGETDRRRGIQEAYNTKHGITPKTIKKAIKDITEMMRDDHQKTVHQELAIDLSAFKGNIKKLIKHKSKEMNKSVGQLDFKTAAIIRDELAVLIDMLERQEEGKKGKGNR